MDMQIYGLVGKSGTGKSYQAMNVAKEKNIDYIIDDGLLISGSAILAGKSAKRQATKVGAIKTALYTDQDHRDQVAEEIIRQNPDAMLILGTSEGMIRKIADRLKLSSAIEILKIEDISTEEEIETAIKQRKELGKHVIPVPAVQLKKHFSGYLLDPLSIFKRWGGKHILSEKSVVRPTFSYLGNFVISDKVITDIISGIVNKTGGVSSVSRVMVISSEGGITIQVVAIMDYGCRIIEVAKTFQKSIAEMVALMTAFNIISVNIEVKGLK
jgi:uncharacterized alkaline shock family protein YloU